MTERDGVQTLAVLMIGKSDTRFHQAFPARHRKGIPLEITFLIAGYEKIL